MMMNVKESENERMERMLQTLNKRGAENYEKRRQETIRKEIERERMEKEQAARKNKEQRKVRKIITQSERIEMQKEELRKIERERKAKDRKELITAVCILVSLVVTGFALDPAGFIEYIEMVGLFIGIAIISGIVGLINSRPHYTKPHRYIVKDEINKNYKVEKGWHTTTFVPKNRR